MSDGKQPVLFTCLFNQCLAIGHSKRHRFFEQQMFARLQHLAGHLEVDVAGEDHIDNFDVRPRQ